jgi:hypothetical protein
LGGVILTGKGKIRYVFTSSHTKQGFYTFIPTLLGGMKKVYVLKGAPGAGKSSLIRSLGQELCQRGYEVDFWLSAEDAMNPEGLYISHLESAVVNGNLPVAIDPKYPGLSGSIVNLSEYLDELALNQHGPQIIDLVEEIEKRSLQAGIILQEASAIREGMGSGYCGRIDRSKLNRLIEELKEEIFKIQPGAKHYFATSFTSEGMINYLEEISTCCKIRYFLKGRAGAGKVINELATKAKERGHSLEYYHCGLSCDQLIMLIISNLQVAIIDGSDMEILLRPGDRLVDLDQCWDDQGEYREGLEHSAGQRQYESLLLQAQAELEAAQKARRNLKRLYSAAMNFELLEEKKKEIFQSLIGSAEKIK